MSAAPNTVAWASPCGITPVEFLEEVSTHSPDDAAIVVTGFRDDPGNAPPGAWAAKPWQYGSPMPLCIERLSNNYFAISAFNADASGRYRRRKDHFARGLVAMLDDLGTKVPTGVLRLPLSALVETSPGNFQGLYFLAADTDSDDRRTFARLIDALIETGLATGGKDPGMAGVTRYGRLPCGVNSKAKLGTPFQVQLREWNPSRRYTVRDIARAYQLDLTPRVMQPRPLPPGGAVASIDSFEQLMQFIAGQGWYLGTIGEWHHIRCPWLHEHTDRCETGTAVRAPGPQNNWAGGFKCFHGHCEKRTIGDLYRIIAQHRRGWEI